MKAKGQLNRAVETLDSAMQYLLANPDDDFRFVWFAEEEIIAKYQPIFSERNIGNLTSEVFQEFLLYRNNHHWDGLHRIGPRLVDDMDLLREGLSILADENKTVYERLDILLPRASPLIPYLGKAIITPILLIKYPHKYCVWNGTSEAGMKKLGMWPPFKRGSNFSEQYRILNDLLLDVAAQLNISLWELDTLWWHVLKKEELLEWDEKGDKAVGSSNEKIHSREEGQSSSHDAPHPREFRQRISDDDALEKVRIDQTTLSDPTKRRLLRCGITTLLELVGAVDNGSIERCYGIGAKRMAEIERFLSAPEIYNLNEELISSAHPEKSLPHSMANTNSESVGSRFDNQQMETDEGSRRAEKVGSPKRRTAFSQHKIKPRKIVKLAKKILVACGSLYIGDLRIGLARKIGQNLESVQDPALLEILEEAGFQISGDLISLSSNQTRAKFSATEEIILSALERAGGFMESPDLRDAIVQEGYSAPTFYNLRRECPFIDVIDIPGRRADYVYLLGLDVDRELAELQERTKKSDLRGGREEANATESIIQYEKPEQPSFRRGEIEDLDQFETWLRWQLSQVEMIGELSMSRKEFRLLGSLLGERVKYLSRGQFREHILKDYPASFATYLVTHGVFNYAGGTFWPGILETLNAKGQWRSMLGEMFHEIIRGFGLETFEDMGGLRFVSPILAHGGIPDYCLSDYFDKVLIRAATHPDYVDMDADEIIDAVLDEENLFIFVDKPVERFLEFGGKVSEDFFSRSLELVDDYVEARELPSAIEYGLPERIGAKFAEWVEKNIDDDDDDLETGTRLDRMRVRKPSVTVDPWGDGVTLGFPSQEIPANLADRIFRWTVQAGAEDAVLADFKLRARKIGMDHRIDSRKTELDVVTNSIRVEFLVDDEPRRSWRVPILKEEAPILICRSSDGALLNWKYTIPGETIWIYRPQGSVLEFTGEVHLKEKLPDLFGAWSGFAGAEWDLSSASQLIYADEDNEEFRRPIRAAHAQIQPHLAGGDIFQANRDPEGVPVYVGLPPKLDLPLSGRQTPGEELKRWRIEIKNRWASLPEVERSGAAEEFGPACSVVGEKATIDLAHEDILGARAWGTYSIRVRGPLGKDADIKFRIWPSIDVMDLQRLYLPSDLGKGTVQFRVAPGADAALIPQADVEGISIYPDEDTPGWSRVEANAKLDFAPVMFVGDPEGGEQIQLPLFIPLPVCKWSAWVPADDQSGAEMSWSTTPIIREYDDILTADESPWLRVSLPDVDNDYSELHVELIAPNGEKIQKSDGLPIRKGWHTYRIPLAQFRDSIRHLESATCKMELVLEPSGASNNPRIHSLTLREPRLVEEIRLVRGDEGQVVVSWVDLKAISEREIRITPVWRIWEPTFVERLPEDAKGSYRIKDGSRGFANGRYQIEIIGWDPWLSYPSVGHRDELTHPDKYADLGTPEERLVELIGAIRREAHNFTARLERACLLDEIGPPDTALRDLEWCIDHLKFGEISQINALHQYLKDGQRHSLRHRLKVNMFAPAHLRRALNILEQDSSQRLVVEEYLEHSPEPQLLSAESAILLLQRKRSSYKLYAIQALMHADDPRAVKHLVDLVSDKKVSDRDALSLLALNGTLAISELSNRASEPIPLRLLEGLIPFLGDRVPFIKTGAWIRTDAGWGKILAIRESPQGERLNHYVHGQEQPILDVVLREGETGEHVRIDLRKGSLEFIEGEVIWICGKCRAFCTLDEEALYDRHNRYAHDGQNTSLVPSRDMSIEIDAIRYAHQRPNRRRLWA